MSGYWLTGYGLVDPGWSAKIDSRDHTDVVNHYLLVLCRYGIIGFIPFIAVVILAINAIIKAFQMSILEKDRWLIWCIAGALFGLLVSLFTVSLFGPPTTILFILFGFCGAMPQIVQETNFRFFAAVQSNPELLNIRQNGFILEGPQTKSFISKT
jgi:O-antigen ligase